MATDPAAGRERDGAADTKRGRRVNPIVEALLRPASEKEETQDRGRTAQAAEDDMAGAEFGLLERSPSILRDPEGVATLSDAYGLVRAYFISRAEVFRPFQRTLDQARWGTTFDRYLHRLVYLTVASALVGVLLGGWLALALVGLGVFQSIGAPAGIAVLFPDWLVATVASGRTVIGASLVTVAIGSGLALLVWYAGLFYPSQRVRARERQIDFVLPDAVVFMYALSESGMTLGDIIEQLADATDAYGEVAAEFDSINREMALYGNDLYTALRKTRNLTPSDNLETFLDDLLSLLDSGGDVTTFLRDQSETYLDRAKEEQADFLNVLALLSEVFIVVFVAAPLFLVVILMVISLLGGSYLGPLAAVIYVGLPLGFLGFGVLLSVLLEPYVYEERELEVPTVAPGQSDADEPAPTEDQEFVAFNRHYRLLRLRKRLSKPIAFFGETPVRTLLITGPLAAVYLVLLWVSGLLPLSVAGWTAAPVAVTNRAVVVPLLVLFVPLSILHERNRRRQADVTRRLPDTLRILSSANSMGIALSDALDVVAKGASGYFASQLRILRRDMRWSSDPSSSLLRFANRLSVPALSRTIKLIAEGRRSTSDLSKVLRIAAEDTRNRFDLVRERQQEMLSYVAVVVVSFLVFVGVILLLDVSYLSPIADISETTTTTDGAGPTALGDLPIDTYRMLFYHAVVVQAVGSGLVSGVLTDNTLRTGLKYSIALLVIAAITFSVI